MQIHKVTKYNVKTCFNW